jgi:hypothetical protein
VLAEGDGLEEADLALRDEEDLAVDARRLLAAETRDQDGDVLGLLRDLHQVVRPHGRIAALLAERLDRRRDHPRLRRGRVHRVDRDVPGREIPGDHVRQPEDAALAGTIRSIAGHADDSRARDEVHDPAPALLHHVGDRMARTVEGAFDVAVADLLEELCIELPDRLRDRESGVVDEDVDAAEGIERRLHDPLRSVPFRHRIAIGDRAPARLADLPRHRLGRRRVAARAIDRRAEIVDDDVRAEARERERGRSPDAASSAGHDGRSAGEIRLHAGAPFFAHARGQRRRAASLRFKRGFLKQKGTRPTGSGAGRREAGHIARPSKPR